MGCEEHMGRTLETRREDKCVMYEGQRRRMGRGRGWALLWPAVAVAMAVALAALAGGARALDIMTLEYTWGTFQYVFDSPQQQEALLAGGNFVPADSTPFDVDVDDSGRVFLSFAAMRGRSNVALATIVDTNKRDSPRLAPYPDWSWHLGQKGCDGLTSVFRIYIECNRLWVIDSGVVDIGNTFEHKCPAQLFVFDLRTDRLIVRHRLPIPPAHNESNLLLNVIAEQGRFGCNRDVYAYIADSGSFALYVFSLRSKRSWRVQSATFCADTNAENVEVNGTKFTIQDGVMGLAQDNQNLYYHSFTSYREAKVPKYVLQNEALFTGDTNRAADQFEYIGSRANQSAGESMNKDRIMFFAEMGTNSLFCWDSSTAYTRDNHHVVERDDTLMHFVTNVKIRKRFRHEEVLVIDNNGQRLFAGEFQPNLPNTVNIMRGPVGALSSKCRRWLG